MRVDARSLTSLEKQVNQLVVEAAARSAPPIQMNLGKLLFDQQAQFALDSARHKTAVCSRRAGKTVGCSASLLDSALRRPGSVSLYLTLSRINAKRIVWRTLREMHRDYKIGGVVNESELAIRLPNGSNIYLAGLSDKTEIDKYRGLPLGIVIVDEAQTVPAYLEELVDAVLVPGLMDFDGCLALVGTPSPVPNGYFHSCVTSTEWSHHEWTVFSNPWIEIKSHKTPREHLNNELRRRGVTDADPVIQREWFAKWVYDPNSLVFRYDAQKNAFTDVPPTKRPYEYIFGVDLGWDDADAIAVLGWSEDAPSVYLVEEWTGRKQTVTELGERLRVLRDKYKPLSIVVDTGGLGKKIAEEISKRTGIFLEAADKVRKLEHIELLNDSLRTGRFYARPTGTFAHDSRLVEWDHSKPERPKISDRFHSDICDAALYAYRKALHWLHSPPTPRLPEIGTPDWLKRSEDEMVEVATQQYEQRRQEKREVEALYGEFE